MATICKKCGGIIPDIGLSIIERNECEHHHKPEINIVGMMKV